MEIFQFSAFKLCQGVCPQTRRTRLTLCDNDDFDCENDVQQFHGTIPIHIILKSNSNGVSL